MSTTAAEAKQKGNEAFKTADYATAVGHYSAAILADRKDPTLPLNRAAAYLKLGKYVDAERDCTTVLDLPTGTDNVKALFRRAQARVAMEHTLDAEKDLRNALRIEPKNVAVATELENILKKKASPPKPSKVSPSSNESPAKPYRRRVPITIVDDAPIPSSSTPPASQPKPNDSIITQISSRSFKPEPDVPRPQVQAPTDASPSNPPAQPKDRGPWDAVQIKGHRVGGGIIRRSAQEKATAKEVVASPSTSQRVVASLGQLPSLFDFTQAWNALPSPSDRWLVLQTIPPDSLSRLFGNSLEPTVLVSIFQAFHSVLSDPSRDVKTAHHVGDYLRHFPEVSRFSFVFMFLKDDEKDMIKSVLGLVQDAGVDVPRGQWNI